MELDDFNTSIKLLLNIYKNTINRYQHINDNSIKFTLLIDKLCIIIDICMSTFETFGKQKIHDDIKDELNTITRDLQNELGKLAGWVERGDRHKKNNRNYELSKSLSDNSLPKIRRDRP